LSAVALRAEADGALQPWQFFLLGGMLAATATVIVATGQSPANIIILSITVVAVSLVGLGAYRVLLPLVSPYQVETPSLAGGRTRLALEREKQLVLRSIKELEFDFAMQKMSQADFDEMGARLRSRALGLMRQLAAGGGYREQIEKEVEKRLKDNPALESEGFSPRSEATAKPATAKAIALQDAACASCGTTNDPDARFCKSCGTKL
jgi:ribosomal protein L40E